MLKGKKLTNYIAYAIGEIVLVVIGILIALWINNWNKENQIAQSNEELQQKVLAQLDRDINKIDISTKHYFNFSEKFVSDYLPSTIELGRSWVQPEYQPSATNRKGLFTLDNLWDGLGALVLLNPEVNYFFGKVTMYTDYNQQARDILLSFMYHYFPDNDELVKPIYSINKVHDCSEFLSKLKGLSYKEGHKVLGAVLKEKDERIPPLINSYMNLSDTMKTFGTAVNPEFGGVEETGILVTIKDIHPSKSERHMDSFDKLN